MKIENDIGGWKSILFAVAVLFGYSAYMVDGIDLVIYYPLYYPIVKKMALMDFSLALLWAGILNTCLDMRKTVATKAELIAALIKASNTISFLLDTPGPKTPEYFASVEVFSRKELEAINKVIVKHDYKLKKIVQG